MSTTPDHEPTFTVRLTAAEAMVLKDAALCLALVTEGDSDVLRLFGPPHDDGGTAANCARMAEDVAERIYKTWAASPDGRDTRVRIRLATMLHDYKQQTN